MPRTSILVENGWRRLEGWDRNAPHVTRLPNRQWLIEGNHGWVDHIFRLRKEKKTIYVSEPYQLDETGLESLFLLTTQGWHVHISGDSEHYPGWTLQIEVSRERE